MSQRADRPRVAQPAAAPIAADAETTTVEPPGPTPAAGTAVALRTVLGALLAAAGLFGLLAVLDIYDVDVAFAAGSVVIVGAIAFGAITQRRVGGLVFLGLLL